MKSVIHKENNNLKYYKSYTASKNYLNEEMMQNPNLKYFFDIHRDSAGKNITTTSYQNKITIENDTIKETERILKTDKYVGNEVINYSHSTTKRTYDYGELTPFDGTIFNPEDFKS